MIERYIRRKISNLRGDSRVTLIGKVIEVKDNSFILDDGSGKIEIFWDGEVEKGSCIRVFCSKVNDEFKADIVQKMDEKEFYLFEKFNELYKRVEKYV